MRCEQELAVGAYLLDALEPEEQLRMREHVARCPSCAHSVAELEGVTRLLAGVDPGTVALPGRASPDPAPSEVAYRRLRSAAAVPAASPAASAPPAPAAPLAPAAGPVVRPTAWRRRSVRVLAATAAAAVVLGGAAVGAATLSGRTAPASAPASAPVTASAAADGVRGHARITAAGSGSLVTLTLDGVPVGERCRLVAVGRDGARWGTYEWQVTQPGPVTWTDTVGVAPRDLERLEVVTAEGRVLLTLRA